jgi:hypothetical protein
VDLAPDAVSNRRVRSTSLKRSRSTVFFAERGWDYAVFVAVIPGADRVTIPSRILTEERTQPRVLFVNSLWGSAYGSTSMDCRHPLRNWVRGVANLQRETYAASSRASSGLADADRGARRSILGHCFAGTLS